MSSFDGYTIAVIIVLAVIMAGPLILFSWLSRRLCCDQQLRHFFAAQREEFQEKVLERGHVPSIRPPPRVLLSFRDVRYAVPVSKNEEKHILRGVNAYFAPGTMTAIMGPSGCGKSTLLDVLADQKEFGTIAGDIRINGQLRSSVFRRASAYVMQFDVLYSELTPRETLFFVTELRLGENVPAVEKYQRVEKTLEELDLIHVADTKIGDGDGAGGLSGGQKRRLTVAIELVTGPGLIMLDEPTSGLDAFGSLRLVKVLRSLADNGRTIACTIHQPRADIFRLFDKLLLMKLGIVMYFGTIDGIFPYFESLGIEVDYSVNPADFIVDLTKEKSPDESEEERRVLERIALARERRKDAQAKTTAKIKSGSMNDVSEEPMSLLYSLDDLEDGSSHVSTPQKQSQQGTRIDEDENYINDENLDLDHQGKHLLSRPSLTKNVPSKPEKEVNEPKSQIVDGSTEEDNKEDSTQQGKNVQEFSSPGQTPIISSEEDSDETRLACIVEESSSKLQSSSQFGSGDVHVPISGLSEIESPRGGTEYPEDVPIEGLSKLESSEHMDDTKNPVSDSEMFKVEPVAKQPSLRGPIEVDLDMICDAYQTSRIRKENLRTIYNIKKGIYAGLPPPLEESYGTTTNGESGSSSTANEKYATGFWKQVRTLARRAIVNDMRNSAYVFGNWVIGPIMMLFYGALYSSVDTPFSTNKTIISDRLDEMEACQLNDNSLAFYDPSFTVNTSTPSLLYCGQGIAEDQQLAFVRASLIYQILAAAYFSEMPYVAQVFLDKRMFFREHAARSYSSGAYHLAWYIRTLFAAFLKGLILVPLGYFAAQLVIDAEAYFLFAIFFGGMSACGSSMAVLCASLFPGMEIASSVFVFVNILAQNLCGYWLVEAFIPPWFIWIYYMNFFRYAFEGTVMGQEVTVGSTDTETRAHAWLYALLVIVFAVGFQMIAFIATWLGNRTVSTDSAEMCVNDPSGDEEFTDESFLAEGLERQSELRNESSRLSQKNSDAPPMRGVSRRNLLDRYREAQLAAVRHNLSKRNSVNTALANNGGIVHF